MTQKKCEASDIVDYLVRGGFEALRCDMRQKWARLACSLVDLS